VKADPRYSEFIRLLAESKRIRYQTRTSPKLYQYVERRIPLHLLKNVNIPPKILERSLVIAEQAKVRIPPIIDIEPIVDLLGWFISEGSHRKWKSNVGISYQTTLSNYDEENRREITSILKRLGFSSHNSTKQVTCNHKLLYLIIEALGVGHHAHKKRIPDLLMNVSPELIARFIKTYIKGDGSWNETYKRYEIKTTSPHIAHSLVTLLHRIGIKKIFTQVEKPKKAEHHPCYRISICEPIEPKTPTDQIETIEVRSIRKIPNDKPTYDIEVPGTHRFLCGTNGYLVAHNSAFGYMGVRGGHSRFTNNYAAALITAKAREKIGEMEGILKGLGLRTVSADTDGLYMIATRPITIDKIRKSVENIGFDVDVDHYKRGLFLAHKNYVLVDDEDKLTIKGSTLVQRSYPTIIRWALRDIMETYLLEGRDAAQEARNRWIKRIKNEDKDSYIFTFTYSLREPDAYEIGGNHPLRQLVGYVQRELRRKIQVSETILLYVKKGSTKSGQIKPFDKWAPYETFKWDLLDRSWYSWFLDEYILKKILHLNLASTGRTETYYKGTYRSGYCCWEDLRS